MTTISIEIYDPGPDCEASKNPHACDQPFELGEDYMIYAMVSDRSKITLNGCSGAKKSELAAADFEALGPGDGQWVPPPGPPGYHDGYWEDPNDCIIPAQDRRYVEPPRERDAAAPEPAEKSARGCSIGGAGAGGLGLLGLGLLGMGLGWRRRGA